MATFNGAAYLDDQLSDLAAQTILPCELVVCDDGSTDGTPELVERFAASAAFPVRIHRNSERLGYRANFLKCARSCTADLIAFCDQDDRWAPDKIETMVACFSDQEVLLAFHGADIIADNERMLGRLGQSPRPIGAAPPLSGSPWTFALGFTQTFQRWLCECDQWWPLSLDHNSAHEPMAHDQWYFFLASAMGTIVNLDAPLVRYRQHRGNAFGWAKARRTYAARLLDRVHSAAWSVERRALAATRRAEILDHAADALPLPYGPRARAGAAAYRLVADRCARRAAIYAGSTIFDRAVSFAKFVGVRGYGTDPRRFGARALAMDLLGGVPGFVAGRPREAVGRRRSGVITP